MPDLDRRSELEAFKRINLSLIASGYGYGIDRRKSTRHSILMASGGDRIIITRNRDHYVYCSVHDPASAGTAIDFAQRVIEPGCSLGRARQLLRPFLNGGYVSQLSRQQSGRYAERIAPCETDLAAVAARYATFSLIVEPHAYLCGERGVPTELLLSARLRGRVLCCPRRGSVVFPHWGRPTEGGEPDRCLVGYEIKGPGVNRFSKGGQKGLWMSFGAPGDRVLAFAESGLDALSYLAIRGDRRTRVASLSGRMNPRQPELVVSALQRMEEGAHIVAAFDNDEAGDQLADQLAALVDDAARPDLVFRDDRPPARGTDWNRVLMDRRQGNALEPAAPQVAR